MTITTLLLITPRCTVLSLKVLSISRHLSQRLGFTKEVINHLISQMHSNSCHRLKPETLILLGFQLHLLQLESTKVENSLLTSLMRINLCLKKTPKYQKRVKVEKLNHQSKIFLGDKLNKTHLTPQLLSQELGFSLQITVVNLIGQTP